MWIFLTIEMPKFNMLMLGSRMAQDPPLCCSGQLSQRQSSQVMQVVLCQMPMMQLACSSTRLLAQSLSAQQRTLEDFL